MKRLQADIGGNLLALDHNRISSFLDCLPVCHTLRKHQKTQPDRRPDTISISPGCDIVRDLAIPQHRFVVMQKRAGVAQLERTQERAVVCCPPLQIGIASDKSGCLVGLASKLKPDLIGDSV